jgi:DNA primase catalytic core
MARIPDAELERLKSDISLQRLVEAKGIVLKRHGADLLGLCPFHDDKEPSLVVSPKKNLWHCLGACQAGGSVIDWVMRAEGVSFRHAVELLRDGLSSLAASSRIVRQSTVPKLPAPVTPDADDQTLLDQVIDYYHATLKQSPEALAYLDRRGIASSEAIARFKLGYANRTLGLRLPEKSRKAGADIRERLQRLGLLRASGHEHFNGSLIIPVLDAHGHVTEVYGRKLLDNLRPGTPLHLYLPGPHRGVWNGEAFAAGKVAPAHPAPATLARPCASEIILCESLIDALTFWCAGYRHVTAAYGVEGFTAEHLAAFKAHGTQRVLIAYDRDAAGDNAAEVLAKQLLATGIDCYRVQFPKGMDANEYALKVTPAAKSLGLALRKAMWMGAGAAPKRHDNAASAPAPTDTIAQASIEVIAAPIAASTASPLAAESLPDAPLPASPVPPAPVNDIAAEVTDTDMVITLGDRRYRVRGLAKNASHETLKVNVLVAMGDAVYVDTLDLYHARGRGAFVTAAAVELQISEDVVKHDLGRVLLKCEALQAERLQAALTPKPIEAVKLSDTERAAALELLRDPQLLERIVADLEACGLVGETTNKLIAYLATVSRRLEAPLAVLIQSTSAAGKTALMDAVLALVPGEDRVKYSALTGQSLFYLGETNLKHKVLAIVEEEGASRAAYALKLLQSEGELTIASTVKDADTGNLVTQQYRVEGPVMLLLTTTAIDNDEELLNRCLVLTVDEGRSQTQAIHRRQRAKRTLAGLLAKHERDHLLTLHQNAQRLLRPLAVVNAYAEQLTFLDDRTRTRRDHEKYLTLIDTIALLHQHQRPLKTVTRRGAVIEYVEVTLDDIAAANRLAHEVLGRSLDELPPQTRAVLAALDAWVSFECGRLAVQRSDYRFSRREVRAALGLADTQLRLHLTRLTEFDYLLVHRGSRGQSFVYELRYDGAGTDGRPFVTGLIDTATLESTATTSTSRGETPPLAGSTRGQSGPNAAGSRAAPSPENANVARVNDDPPGTAPKPLISRGNGQRASYGHAAS